MLVVQVVEIFWTKATRGAPRARERVGLPRAFAIEPPSGEGNCWLQRVRLDERVGFAPERRKLEALPAVPGLIDEALSIRSEAGGVYLLGLVGVPLSGLPRRHPRRDVLRLAPGEYARLAINARHASTSGQFYAETVYNVCSSGTGPPPPDRFLHAAPAHELDLKAHLF